MNVRLGNSKAKQGRYEPVNADDHSKDELEERARGRGVSLADDPTKETIASRLSSLVIPEPLEGKRVTSISFPPGTPFTEALVTVTHQTRGIWANHSAGPPDWVESDDEELATAIARHYSQPEGHQVQIGAPADLEATHWTEAGPPGIGPDGPIGKKGGKG